MDSRVVLLACLLTTHPFVLSDSPCWAIQSSDVDDASEPALDEAERQQIRALREGLLKAVIEKDTEALLGFLTEDVVVTTQDGLELRVIRQHEGVRDYMERLLTGKEPIIKSLRPNVEAEEPVLSYGDATVVALGTSDDHYVLSSGGEFDLATRWSATVVRDGETWKLASLHVSSNLFDNPIFNAAKNSLYRVGGIALSVGLIVGLLLAKLLSKRAA